METLLGFYQEGRAEGTFESGIRKALARVLIDPRFIFRMEHVPANLAAGTPYRLSDLELATRLSFFLWSSIPDDELLNLAIAGKLSNADGARAADATHAERSESQSAGRQLRDRMDAAEGVG